MNNYNKNDFHKRLSEIDTLSDESPTISKHYKIKNKILIVLLIISLFCASYIIVWLVSTDSQRKQTNLFIEQALNGNIDFSILQNTKLEALAYINWSWSDDKEPKNETLPTNKEISYHQSSTLNIPFSSSSKHENLYSCSVKSIPKVDKIRIYKWKDSEGQTHMSDKFPKNTIYHDLTVKNLNSSDFFTLNLNSRYSNLPAFASDRMKRDVNQIYKILNKNVGVSKLNPITLNLKLFDDERIFNAYKKKVAPKMGTVGGFYMSRNNEAVVYTGKNDKRMYEVTRHEATHAIVHGAFGNAPVWLNEGLAEYFETLSFKNGMTRLIEPHQAHLKLLANSNLPDLSNHFKLTRTQWYSESMKDKHYALGWSLVYFMMSSERDKEFLKYMLDHLAYNYCKPFDDITYINKNYPGGLNEFERNWKRWLASSKSKHRY